MRRLAAALAVAAIVAGCGGCGAAGGGDGARSATTDPTPNWKPPNGLVYVTPGLTKARFMAHLNRYCRRHWRVVQRDPSAYFASLGLYVYSAIQSFGTAPGERGRVEHLLFAMNDGMQHGERSGVANPARVEAAFAEYNQTARRLGLDGCTVAGPHIPHREA